MGQLLRFAGRWIEAPDIDHFSELRAWLNVPDFRNIRPSFSDGDCIVDAGKIPNDYEMDTVRKELKMKNFKLIGILTNENDINGSGGGTEIYRKF